jgi:hypothetical protein
MQKAFAFVLIAALITVNFALARGAPKQPCPVVQAQTVQTSAPATAGMWTPVLEKAMTTAMIERPKITGQVRPAPETVLRD